MSFEDYLKVRVFHLLLSTFYYEGNIEEAFAFAKERGVKPFDIIVRLQQMLDRAPAGFRKVIDDFVVESKEELFESREAVVEWARTRLPALISGELGGNLLSKYSMLGRFYATHEGLDFLQLAIAESLGDRLDAEGRDELSAVMDYLRTVLLHVPFRETMRRTPSFTAAFDVEAWRDADFARPPIARSRAATSRRRCGLPSASPRWASRPGCVSRWYQARPMTLRMSKASPNLSHR